MTVGCWYPTWKVHLLDAVVAREGHDSRAALIAEYIDRGLKADGKLEAA